MAEKKTSCFHFLSLLGFDILFAPGSRFDAIASLLIPDLWMTWACSRFVEATLVALLDILCLIKRQTRRLHIS
jgi:hypothetical protein